MPKRKQQRLEQLGHEAVPQRVRAARQQPGFWLEGGRVGADMIISFEPLFAHQYGIERAAAHRGDKLGKTIIFAKNRNHAALITERFDLAYPHLKGEFASTIDYKTRYSDNLLDRFSTLDLSTGRLKDAS